MNGSMYGRMPHLINECVFHHSYCESVESSSSSSSSPSRSQRIDAAVDSAMSKIRELAFEGVVDETYFFSSQQLRRNNLDVPLVTQLGFLNENQPVGNNPWAKPTYSFTHKMFQVSNGQNPLKDDCRTLFVFCFFLHQSFPSFDELPFNIIT